MRPVTGTVLYIQELTLYFLPCLLCCPWLIQLPDHRAKSRCLTSLLDSQPIQVDTQPFIATAAGSSTAQQTIPGITWATAPPCFSVPRFTRTIASANFQPCHPCLLTPSCWLQAAARWPQQTGKHSQQGWPWGLTGHAAPCAMPWAYPLPTMRAMLPTGAGLSP